MDDKLCFYVYCRYASCCTLLPGAPVSPVRPGGPGGPADPGRPGCPDSPDSPDRPGCPGCPSTPIRMDGIISYCVCTCTRMHVYYIIVPRKYSHRF